MGYLLSTRWTKYARRLIEKACPESAVLADRLPRAWWRNERSLQRSAANGAALPLLLSGVTRIHDYTATGNTSQVHPVLPRLESTDINATYSCLSTITMPLAEHGYYVFPVGVVDQLFKENGMPTSGEMHQAPLNKIREIIGADAVLYITIKEYGSSYQVINSATTVRAEARLVDTVSGTVLWAGTVAAQENSSGGTGSIIGELVAAVLTQVINQSTDRARHVCRLANTQFGTKSDGLLFGPYHPGFGTN
jgi:hypothetical protein